MTKFRKTAFRANLLKLNPPERVILKFDRLCEINDEFELEDRLEDMLFDVCKFDNWTRPWERDGVSLTIRARMLDHEHPEYKQDSGGENSPAEEQCFRRGYDHGFHRAYSALASLPKAQEILEPLADEIHRWRTSRFHDLSAILWGSVFEAEYPCVVRSIARRSGLPLKLRFEILQRDGRRCVCCGVTASEGAVLEVDHIVPVAKGGTDERSNLQTLCFDCNRGKSDMD